jgi:hypothetical protein
MMVSNHPQGVVLSMDAMKGETSWDAALEPFPPHPDFHLLEEARQRVITYLDWVTHDLAQGPSADQLQREIERATERLLEVSLALRAFFNRGSCALEG